MKVYKFSYPYQFFFLLYIYFDFFVCLVTRIVVPPLGKEKRNRHKDSTANTTSSHHPLPLEAY